MRAQLRRFGGRFANHGLSKAWNAWIEMSEQRARLLAVGRRFANPALTRCLNAWIEAAAEAAHKQRQARKALGRLRNRELVGCWMIWSELTSKLAEQRIKLRRVLRRLVHAKAGAAFNSWVGLVDERRQMAKVLRYALHAGVGKAWRRWEEMVEERERLRAVALKVGRRMLHRVAATVFDSWCVGAPPGPSPSTAASAPRSSPPPALHSCLRSSSSHRYEAVQATVEAREATLRKVLIQMHLRWVALCFRAWAGTASGAAAERTKALGGALGRMRMRAAALCLEAWVALFRESQALREKYGAVRRAALSNPHRPRLTR